MSTSNPPPPPSRNRVIRITGRGVSPEADPLQGLAGIDLAAGRASLMGNEKLYRRLLAMFVRQHADFAARLRAALAAGDIGATTRMAHDLGGLAASLGMRSLAPRCRAFELACMREAAPDELEPLIVPLTIEVQCIVQALSAVRSVLVSSI